MKSRTERDLRLWKTRKAAENNASKITAEFSQIGQPMTWIAVQKPNGWWTIDKAVK